MAKDRREYLQTFQSRKGTAQKQLNRAIHRIQTTNLGLLDRNELKMLANPIIREARKRMRELENAGLKDSPAYRFIKSELGGYPTAAGTDRNTILHNIREATDFLHAKTSLVENAEEYNIWLDEHLGMDTTPEEREEIWDVVHRFETQHPQLFMNFGYDEAIKKIATAYILGGNDTEYATAQMYEYLKGRGRLAEIERGDGEELNRIGITPWFNNSTRG